MKGVEIKSLISHGDDRGFFREVFRATESIFMGGVFGQWSHSKMEKNVVKAWHYHHVQTDWWYVPFGEVRTVLVDYREESTTFKEKLELNMGESNPVCVRIPPGVLHGCRVLSAVAHLFYITSHTYDPNEEGRYPYNDPEIGYDWGEPCIVAPNDTKRFIPLTNRKAI